MNRHGQHLHGILREIESNHQVSQRHLARRLGIALGLANLLLRRLIAKGWVEAVHLRANRVRYVLTPAGVAAKARLGREYLEGTVHVYTEARERVKERFAELSAELDALGRPKRIVFYGSGEIAEIGYVSLQETDLQLVAVIDGSRTKPFFGVPVYPLERVTGLSLHDCSFERIVVMSFGRHGIAARLGQRGIGREHLFWL